MNEYRNKLTTLCGLASRLKRLGKAAPQDPQLLQWLDREVTPADLLTWSNRLASCAREVELRRTRPEAAVPTLREILSRCRPEFQWGRLPKGYWKAKVLHPLRPTEIDGALLEIASHDSRITALGTPRPLVLQPHFARAM